MPYWDCTNAHSVEWKFRFEWACVSETDTILYEPCIPFYDGQRFWYVLRLLPEIQGSENRCGRVFTKTYSKIWPYFALLCVLDFVMSPSKSALYEFSANLTLCQGLLPNMNISVIGVSWTLAVIFVFYLLFPFFCFPAGKQKTCMVGLYLCCNLQLYV